MSALIDDMLELSHTQRAPLRRTQVDVSVLAQRTLDALRQTEPARQVEVDVSPGLTAYADSHLLGVVLEKLLGNAWKFTGKKSVARICVGLESSGTETALFVADDGAGFDMAYASRLFSPFQRLHKATDFAGTGIGLAIAHRIVSRHGGRIWAQAEVGKGAKLCFTFGAADE
jgi:light-regulated signal transduction histidine kinase (bacteriophytochrome)